MSRSNAPPAHPGTQPGGWPQQRPAQQPVAQAQQSNAQQSTYEQDLAAWNAQQQARWPQQTPAAAPGYSPPQGYAPSQGGYAAPEHTPRTAPPAYHYPATSEGHDPYSRQTLGGREHGGREQGGRETTAPPSAHGHGYGQTYAPVPGQQAYPQQSYAPEFDPYTPPQPADAPSYGAQPGYGQVAQPPHYGGGYHAEPAPTYASPAYAPASQEPLSTLQRSAPAAPAPELRGAHYDQGFEQWSQPVAYQPQPAVPDPRGYDLGGYAPAAEPAAYRQPLPLDHGHTEWAGHDDRYPPQGQYEAYAQPQAFPQHHAHGQTGFDPAAHAHDPSLQQHAGGQLEPTYQHEEAGAEYEIEERPAGRRWGLIAAALVGAIAVGGGMAYGYKMLYGKGPATAAAPLVKNAGTPTKVKPAEPGGKQFAHTDSKIMGRLNDQSASATAPTATPSSASADSDPNGARKVQTVVVGRDGSIVPPAAAPAATAGPQPVTVPGMTIVDGFGGRPPAAAIAAAQPAAAPTPARPVVVNPPAPAAAPVVAAPAKPTVLARAAPVSVSDAAPVAVTKPALAAPAKVAIPKVAIPKKVAAVTPAARAAPAPTGGNGYVAVLASVPASQKSSMDALKQFADMQQKYGTALANKTPEVREANLGDKGTYHRLLVGPPGSREQAGQLCTQLKAAGYASCWVTAY